jgi:iron complex outermembrane recepter protein
MAISKVRGKKVQSIACFAISTLVAAMAQAQSADDTLQRVEITGSSIKRVDAETSLPVTIISRDDIVRSGATTAQDLVALIPSVFGGSVVANNVGATGVPSTANLRGLGSKYTLVLLNGRRVANYAFGNSPVDLNSIPLSAIERVEVVRDGASAVYGADAVAGVINFILRKDYEGAEVSVGAATSQQGGGGVRNINFLTGFGNLQNQGYNVMISANHEVDDVLHATDRAFANSAIVPSLGVNKASPRNGIPNLNFKDTLGNSYIGVNPSRYNGCDRPDFALAVISAKGCGTDYAKFIDLIPSAVHDNLVARGEMALNKDQSLYAEYAYTKDNMVASYSPAPYTKSMVYPTTGRFYPASIVIPKGYTTTTTYNLANGSTLPTGTVLANDITVTPTGPLSGTWRTVAGGGRTDLTETTNQRVLLGSKGFVAGWDYDTALTYAENKGVISFGPGKFSYAKLTPLVASGAINVFGPQDATSLAALNSALLTGPEQSAVSTSTEFDFKFSREVAQWEAGAVGVAVGATFRSEKLAQTSYPILETGDEVGGSGPIPSVTGDRQVMGLFAEANIPVVKDMEINLAARYDSYTNGFGTSFSALSPKASLRYQPTKELLFRGAVGVGYRAPTLYENLRPFTSGNNTSANWSDPVRCPGGVPVTSVNAVGAIQDECAVQLSTATSGSKELNPEKSRQYSLGIVLQPTANFSAALDYWDVRISDAVQAQSEIQVFNSPTSFVSSFYRYDPALYPDGWSDDGKQTGAIKGSTNPNFPLAFVNLPYANQGQFFAAGIDINLNYKTKLEGVGTLGANLDGTYMTKHGYQYLGKEDVSDIGIYQDFGPMPRWRHALTMAISTGTWSASVTQNYTSGYQDYTNQASIGDAYPAVRMVDAYVTWDAAYSYRGIKNLEVLFGVKNLLNQDPPVSRIDANFQVGYDAGLANPLGRQYRLAAKYKF